MKIAMPVEIKSMESNVCKSFGRAPYFLIYDTESKESVFLENSATKSQGGAGIRAAQIILDNKANALLTPQCGENAAEVFRAANVKIYKANNGPVTENINDFNSGKISLLDDVHPGFHNHS